MNQSPLKYLVTKDNSKICYDTCIFDISQPVCVLLHGMGGDLTAWKNVRRLLTQNRVSTIAVDLRGHGFSSRSSKVNFYLFDHFSQDVVDLLAAENVKTPILVGHCLGGMVALHTCLNFPHLFKSLILIDTSYTYPHFVAAFNRNPVLKKLLHLTTTIASSWHLEAHVDIDHFKNTSDFDPRRIISDILHTSLKSYLQISQQLLAFDLKSSLGKLNLNTLIIHGRVDTVFPPQIAEELHHLIPSSQLSFISHGNHITVINNPDAVAKEILSVLNS